MKIAFFTDTYEPQINGVVTAINLFAKHLRKQGHGVHIFYPSADKKPAGGNYHKFVSMGFRNYPGYRIAIPYALMFDKEFKDVKFDVVHVHTPAVIGVAGLLLAKLYHKPVVGSFHTLIPEYSHYFLGSLQNIKPFKRLAKMLLWKYTAMFYNKCDIVVVPSEQMKKTLIRYRIKRDVVVIPTGVEAVRTGKSKAALRKKYGFAAKDRIILHVGRLDREKNIKAVLKALNGIKDRNAKMVITSDGPYRGWLENEAKKMGISNRIIFTGFIGEKTLNDYYNMSDVFVMASKTETQGLVLAEAAAHGLPIVALNSPVIAEFVKKNNAGIVSDEKRFSESIQRAFSSKNKFARNNAMKNYNIEKCTKDLIEVYSKITK